MTLLLVGCSSGGDDASEGREAVTPYGRPGLAVDADRVVEIVQSEEGGLRFDPETLDVAEGETVTLRVRNEGEILHELTLGDEATQAAHEEEMAAMGGARGSGMAMRDQLNAIAVEPGETVELTWVFSQPGEVIYGCHEPGHYEAGMWGVITVS